MNNDKYTLPELPYKYNELLPYISKEQLTIHHQKHHQAYVNGANTILEKIVKARVDGVDIDMRAVAKELSFNVGGHFFHSLFWANLKPSTGEINEPIGKLLKTIISEFGTFERFKKEFAQTAMTVEGSGWAALTICPTTRRPMIMQVEKHNANLYPQFPILLVIDMFEHAYYLDYKNEKAKFIDAFWSIVNWGEVGRRFEKAVS
ncbi:MAG: superoxide dismutase [bacterium]